MQPQPERLWCWFAVFNYHHEQGKNVAEGIATTTHKMMPMAPDRLAWIDLETTGLDHDTDRILEVGIIITDNQMTCLESYSTPIFQTPGSLENMSEFARNAHSTIPYGHSRSLVEMCSDPSTSVPLQTAEKVLCDILDRHRSDGMGNQAQMMMAGSSIWNDKMFLRRWMPEAHKRLHYRLMDVTTVLEACRRFCPNFMRTQPKSSVGHRVLVDIESSINLMRHYKNYLFECHDDRQSRTTRNECTQRRRRGKPYSSLPSGNGGNG